MDSKTISETMFCSTTSQSDSSQVKFFRLSAESQRAAVTAALLDIIKARAASSSNMDIEVQIEHLESNVETVLSILNKG